MRLHGQHETIKILKARMSLQGASPLIELAEIELKLVSQQKLLRN